MAAIARGSRPGESGRIMLRILADGLAVLSLMPARAAAHPAAVHRMMRADELEERGAALGVLVEGAPERRDDLRRLADVLGVEADRPRHRGHAGRAVLRHLPGERIVAAAPEAGAVAGVAAVVDVQRRDPDAVARHRLEAAHHVADAGVAGDVHA